MPQGCVRVDGNIFLCCLHQCKLWMPCQQVEKSLNHPACLASSPFQPWAILENRVGCSQCLHPAPAACDSLFHAPSPAGPARSPSTTSTKDFRKCRSSTEALRGAALHHAPGTPAARLTPWSVHPTGRTGRAPLQWHSPLTPLEVSRWLWWEQDHILTQVEADQ